MEAARYSEKVQGLLRQLDEAEIKGLRTSRRPAEELLAEGLALGDPALTGAAWFYCGSYYYSVSELEAGTDCMTKAIPYLQRGEEWSLLERCYNMLALMMDLQDDVAGSIDCFNSGIALAREHKDAFYTAVLCLNLSLIFEEAEDWESALEFRRAALEELEGARSHGRYGEIRMLGESMLLRLYLRMDREQEAHAQMAAVNRLLETYPEERNALNVLVYQADYAFRCGETAHAARLREEVLHAFYRAENVIDSWDDCLSLARCLAAAGDFARCMEVMDLTEQGIAGGSETDVRAQCQLQICRIDCCRQWGEPGRAREEHALRSYYELTRRRGRYYREIRRRMYDLRHTVDDTRSENARLAHRAATDPLTGLANRSKLQDMQDDWFESAQREGVSFAVAMVDIDRFKRLNDGNGHAGGDRCLVFLAELLRRETGEHAFAARYGGDEFILLYTGMTDEEITRRICALRRAVEESSAAQGCGTFTISVGARNSVPRADNHIWDYTAAADAALYQIKQCGRNDFLLVHSTKDVPAKSWMSGPGARCALPRSRPAPAP